MSTLFRAHGQHGLARYTSVCSVQNVAALAKCGRVNVIATELCKANVSNRGDGFELFYAHRTVYLYMLNELGKWWTGERVEGAWLVNRK